MSAAEQLRLFQGAKRISASPEIDLVDAMIFAHGGDARRAVAELKHVKTKWIKPFGRDGGGEA
jgi:hypothetical protein